MASERGQATVEWTGLLLLVALALVALSHLASKADGRELGNPATRSPSGAGGSSPDSPRTHPEPAARSALPGPGFPRFPRRGGRRRARGRGGAALWRKAWFACLVYERTRYAFRHPESQFPGYTLPYGDALRMINSCLARSTS